MCSQKRFSTESYQDHPLDCQKRDLISPQLPTPTATGSEPSQQYMASRAKVGVPVAQLVPRDSDWVISRIETIFESFADTILEDRKSISIPVKARAAAQNHSLDPASGSIQATTSAQTRDVSFPGNDPHEAWQFTIRLRILGLIHQALVNRRITTKRNIYYKDPTLFICQGVVDRCVDSIACTFGVQRACLNVAAAAKGLVLGVLTVKRVDDSLIDFTCESEGQLVPNVKEIRAMDISGLEWVLVIEKEATFRSLAESAFWRTSKAGKGLILTAKGYPDISTRAFLRLLSEQSAVPGTTSPRIYALVDFDPDGMAILSTYKYGSMAMAHENAYLNVSSIRWIGVKNSDICSTGGIAKERGLLRMSARDRRLAVKMLEKGVFVENGPETEWRRELQVMLMMNTKAEIQILSERAGDLEKWLESKINLESV